MRYNMDKLAYDVAEAVMHKLQDMVVPSDGAAATASKVHGNVFKKPVPFMTAMTSALPAELAARRTAGNKGVAAIYPAYLATLNKANNYQSRNYGSFSPDHPDAVALANETNRFGQTYPGIAQKWNQFSRHYVEPAADLGGRMFHGLSQGPFDVYEATKNRVSQANSLLTSGMKSVVPVISDTYNKLGPKMNYVGSRTAKAPSRNIPPTITARTPDTLPGQKSLKPLVRPPITSDVTIARGSPAIRTK